MSAKIRIVTRGTGCAPVIEVDGINLASVVGQVTIDWEPGEPPVVTLTIPSPILLLEADAEVVAKVHALVESPSADYNLSPEQAQAAVIAMAELNDYRAWEPGKGARSMFGRGLRYMWAAGSAPWLCHLTPIDKPEGRLPRSLCGNLPRSTKIHTALRLPAKRAVCGSCERRAAKHWRETVTGTWVPKRRNTNRRRKT